MSEVSLFGDKRMTVKEVAESLGVADVTVNQNVAKLFPGLAKNGIKTYLDESQVTEIKKAIQSSGRNDLMNVHKLSDITTDIEMQEKTIEVLSWLKGKLDVERAGRLEAERKNSVLMHVNKTYTATEIAKEIGMRSAQELNDYLHDNKIQFYQNGTWVPYADYANLGYFDIKQEVLDSGRVVYHRKITQDGRSFIVDLFEGSK